MSISEFRSEIAQAITEGLEDIQIDPYKDPSPAPFTGWLQISKTDTENCTFGEVRLSIECLILVATDRTDFEKVQDTLTVPLINAVLNAGGRGIAVEPAEIPVGQTTLYCLSASFVIETLT